MFKELLAKFQVVKTANAEYIEILTFAFTVIFCCVYGFLALTSLLE